MAIAAMPRPKRTGEAGESKPKIVSETDQQLGRRIARARLDAEMTQKELAQAVGTSPATMSRWESGTHQVPTNDLVRLGKLLERPVSWFYGEAEAIPRNVSGTGIERLPARKRRFVERWVAEYVATEMEGRDSPPAK